MTNVIKLFKREFGEAIDFKQNPTLLAVSAPRIEAIVDNKLFFKTYKENNHKYIVEYPRFEKGKIYSVEKGKALFDLDRIKRILDLFSLNSIDGGVYNETENYFFYIKIDLDYGIVLAEKIRKETPCEYEVFVNWRDVFQEQTFTDDMEL